MPKKIGTKRLAKMQAAREKVTKKVRNRINKGFEKRGGLKGLRKTQRAAGSQFSARRTVTGVVAYDTARKARRGSGKNPAASGVGRKSTLGKQLRRAIAAKDTAKAAAIRSKMSALLVKKGLATVRDAGKFRSGKKMPSMTVLNRTGRVTRKAISAGGGQQG